MGVLLRAAAAGVEVHRWHEDLDTGGCVVPGRTP